MRVLITGICGFVGAALARELRGMVDCEVLGVDNLIRAGSHLNRAELLKLGVKVWHGDIRNASDMETLPKADWVIDAAANPSVLAGIDGRASSRQLLEHNLLGTMNLLEYCKQHGAGFLMLSTSRVYSIPALTVLPLEERNGAFRLKDNAGFPKGVTAAGVGEEFSTTAPISLYGASKLCSEALALEYAETFQFPVWINRCGVLAGAGQFGKADQGIFSYWIHSWHGRRPLKYIGFGGRGSQVRDALHPRDLATLLRKQLMEPSHGGPRTLNVAGGLENSISLSHLSHWCAKRFGQHEVIADTEPRRFDVPWLVLDSTKTNELWDWTPHIKLDAVLEEIALHAECHPDWLDVTAG